MVAALTFSEAMSVGDEVFVIAAAIIAMALRLTWYFVLPALGSAWLLGWLK